MKAMIECPSCGTRYAYEPAADFRTRRKPDGTTRTVCAHVMCDGWRDGLTERAERERRIAEAARRRARAELARERRRATQEATCREES